MCHIADFLHRHYLSYPINNVCYMDNFRFGGNSFFISIYNCFIILNWKVKADFFVNNSFPCGTLFPGINHVWTILFGTNNFISWFKSNPYITVFNASVVFLFTAISSLSHPARLAKFSRSGSLPWSSM